MYLKQITKKVSENLICMYYKLPKSCKVHYTAKLRNVKCEGKNKISYKANVSNCEIGFGTFIGRQANYSGCKIGRFSSVGGDILAGEHPIHKIVSIHPALYSTTGQYGFTYVSKMKFNEFKYVDYKNKYHVIIGNDVWVTNGAKVIEGVTIGDGAVVMTGAIVTKDVPPYAIVGGIPAKIVGYRFNEEEIKFLLELKWWDKGEIWIKEHAEYFEDIEKLMEVVKKEQ